jgi:aryl-alcohol dehydrogenase-like predicted oxidoreductase
MEIVRLGTTGLQVSRICMGTMQFGWSIDEGESIKVLTAAYEAGINIFDTADVYSNWAPGNPGGVSENILGKWMKANHIPRDRVVIATKVSGKMGEGPNDQGLSRAHVLQAVEASLGRMQTEYIDLYQAHSPDENTPIEETLHVFGDLVVEGKVRYVGASNYNASQLVDALWNSENNSIARFATLQPKYNLIQREEFEAELKQVCVKFGLGVLPYSPLRGGFLTGKYRKGKKLPRSTRAESAARYLKDPYTAVLEKLDEIGKSHNATPAQVTLAWLLADPVITSPIIGATSVDQLNENLGCLTIHLTTQELSTLEELTNWR